MITIDSLFANDGQDLPAADFDIEEGGLQIFSEVDIYSVQRMNIVASVRHRDATQLVRLEKCCGDDDVKFQFLYSVFAFLVAKLGSPVFLHGCSVPEQIPEHILDIMSSRGVERRYDRLDAFGRQDSVFNQLSHDLHSEKIPTSCKRLIVVCCLNRLRDIALHEYAAFHPSVGDEVGQLCDLCSAGRTIINDTSTLSMDEYLYNIGGTMNIVPAQTYLIRLLKRK